MSQLTIQASWNEPVQAGQQYPLAVWKEHFRKEYLVRRAFVRWGRHG